MGVSASEGGGREEGGMGGSEGGRRCQPAGLQLLWGDRGEEEGGRTRVLWGSCLSRCASTDTRLRGDNEARAQLRATPRR